jgi:hypothetical protein
VPQVGAVRASTAKALSREISTSALALSRAFERSDEFSLESAAKARHRGDHRRRGASRHASLAQHVRVAPKSSRGFDAITSFFLLCQEHASRRRGLRPTWARRRGLRPTWARRRRSSSAALALSRAFCVRMRFHSNSPRKLAIAATIGGAAYRGTRVSQPVRVAPKSSRGLIRSRALVVRLRSTPRDGVDSDPRGRDGVSARARASRIKGSCAALMRNFECHIGPAIVHWRARMGFHSNPQRKLAIGATIGGAAYRGTGASLSASESREPSSGLTRSRASVRLGSTPLRGTRWRRLRPRGRDGGSICCENIAPWPSWTSVSASQKH